MTRAMANESLKRPSNTETPDIVYGRLLEAAHIGGYAAERVAGEFKWLLTEDRWKKAAGGFDDIEKFLAAINLAKYRINIDDFKEIVRLLETARATQRASAKALGVSHVTVGNILRDGKKLPNADGEPTTEKSLGDESGHNLPNSKPAWFQAPPAEIARPAQQKLIREEKEAKREERREENRAKVESIRDPLSAGIRFATIVIDPPWDFGDEGDVDQFGRGRPVYAQMSFEKICAVPIPQLADIDCHLYLWITNRSLPKGFDLIERWGFRYITCLTWCKPSIGMGNYFRGSSEQILFAVKGSQALKRKDVGTWFSASRGEQGHSSKPDEFYELVKSCSPGPYLDYFGRKEREGITVYGADA